MKHANSTQRRRDTARIVKRGKTRGEDLNKKTRKKEERYGEKERKNKLFV